MKHIIKSAGLIALSIIFLSANSFAQDSLQVKNKNQKGKLQQKGNTIEHGNRFVDLNGDGYNDNAPDHDGDGIPNGLDPDYQGANKGKNKFVDLDGDGINDNAGKGKGKGAGKGKANKGVGPKNGKGSGVSGAGSGSGNCDGTGPKGQKGKGKNK